MKAHFSLVAAAVALCSPLVTWACINDSYVGLFEEGVLARYLPSWLLIIIPVCFFLGFCLFVVSRYLDSKEKLTFSEKLGTWEFLIATAIALLFSLSGLTGFIVLFIWGIVCFADSIMNFSLGRHENAVKRMLPVFFWIPGVLVFFASNSLTPLAWAFVFSASVF